jgi:hypothetical protein
MSNKKIHRHILLIILIFFCTSLSFAQRLKIPIDKGIISDSFNITFLDRNVTLEAGSEFSLKKIGIKSSDDFLIKNLALVGTNKFKAFSKRMQSNYGRKHFAPYRIKIYNKYSGVTYYGILSFFNTNKRHAQAQECQVYNITIPQTLFKEASNGAICRAYEYFESRGHTMPLGLWLLPLWPIMIPASYGAVIEEPTWIIFFSKSESIFENSKISFKK